MNTAIKTKTPLVLALATASILLATSSFAAIEGGDTKRGKVLAKEKCKHCHVAGADGGTMTPLSKTQRQWERFYKKGKHEKMAPGTWDKITEQELKHIMQFMYEHAADSDQPETCGR
jgi:cytochrome c5